MATDHTVNRTIDRDEKEKKKIIRKGADTLMTRFEDKMKVVETPEAPPAVVKSTQADVSGSTVSAVGLKSTEEEALAFATFLYYIHQPELAKLLVLQCIAGTYTCVSSSPSSSASNTKPLVLVELQKRLKEKGHACADMFTPLPSDSNSPTSDGLALALEPACSSEISVLREAFETSLRVQNRFVEGYKHLLARNLHDALACFLDLWECQADMDAASVQEALKHLRLVLWLLLAKAKQALGTPNLSAEAYASGARMISLVFTHGNYHLERVDPLLVGQIKQEWVEFQEVYEGQAHYDEAEAAHLITQMMTEATTPPTRLSYDLPTRNLVDFPPLLALRRQLARDVAGAMKADLLELSEFADRIEEKDGGASAQDDNCSEGGPDDGKSMAEGSMGDDATVSTLVESSLGSTLPVGHGPSSAEEAGRSGDPSLEPGDDNKIATIHGGAVRGATSE